MNLQKIKHSCATLLVLSFVLLPVSHKFSIKQVEAGGWPVIDVASITTSIQEFIQDMKVSLPNLKSNIANLKANTLIAKTSVAADAKEFGFDAIAWAAANMLLEEMISATTQWAASGFKGEGPAFVTDLDGFLRDVGDQAVGEFIAGVNGPLSNICDPFSFQIRGALGIQYGSTGKYYYEPRCTLSNIVDNMEGFLDGNFYDGGWDGWASMTLNANNNIYGQTFQAQKELGIRIQNDRTRESEYLDFGNGFFSMQDCKTVDGKEVCNNTTPGVTLEKNLNEALALPGKRLTIADEIDELLGVLLTQIVGEVISGGLSGFDSKKNNLDPKTGEDRRTTLPATTTPREGPEEIDIEIPDIEIPTFPNDTDPPDTDFPPSLE